MNNGTASLSIISGITAALLGCSSKAMIRYDLDRVSAYEESPARGSTLLVASLEDHRREQKGVDDHFTHGREIDRESYHVCINAERGYKHKPVVRAVKKQIARHLDRKKVFERVVTGGVASADYYLSAELTYFYGMQQYSMGSAVLMGVGAGLGGAVGGAMVGAAMTKESFAEVIVELRNVGVWDAGGRKLVQVPVIAERTTSMLRTDPDCRRIYDHVNARLNGVTEKLADALYNAMLNPLELPPAPIYENDGWGNDPSDTRGVGPGVWKPSTPGWQ
jgi:hypothetical protein